MRAMRNVRAVLGMSLASRTWSTTVLRASRALSAKRNPARRAGKWEFRESAVVVLHEEDAEDDWIELPTFNGSHKNELTEKERQPRSRHYVTGNELA
jgi:hypothetical protein